MILIQERHDRNGQFHLILTQTLNRNQENYQFNSTNQPDKLKSFI